MITCIDDALRDCTDAAVMYYKFEEKIKVKKYKKDVDKGYRW